MSWLRLIRWSNLLIVFFTQFLAWICVVLPLEKTQDIHLLLGIKNFMLLSLSTVLIAAAGYIINDYFDVKIDNINKPEKMVLDKNIPRKHAILLHTFLNLLGIGCAFLVAGQAGHYEWVFLQIGCTAQLWFYSTHFKRKFMIGNVTVALLTSLTIISLIVYEPLLHSYIFKTPFAKTASGHLYLSPLWLLGFYAGFAFLLTWMREIVKDMEDLKGDAVEGCMTMPIKWGLQKAGLFTQVLGGIAILALVISVIALFSTSNYILAVYSIITLIIPLSKWIFVLNQKAITTHYTRASRQLKILMVAGIGTLIINYIQEWLRSF